MSQKIKNKYLVLKWEDIDMALPGDDLFHLRNILWKISSYRRKQGKFDNTYYVVNQDEPYAEDVFCLILDGEKTKEYQRETLDINTLRTVAKKYGFTDAEIRKGSIFGTTELHLIDTCYRYIEVLYEALNEDILTAYCRTARAIIDENKAGDRE